MLLFFGYIREYKGLEYLLKAMDGLPGEEGYHLLIVGEFYEDELKYEQHLKRLKQN